jgi:hypothetical protein
MAADGPSQRVDETTTLQGVEGDGSTLRYYYEVSVDAEALPLSMQRTHRAELRLPRPCAL